MELSKAKDLFYQGVEYSKKNYNSLFFDRQDDLCDFQKGLVEKAEDSNSFMNALWLSNNTLASAYNKPKSVCNGCELEYTGVQFGIGNIEWYFYYGIAETIGFNFNFIKLEITPPSVIDKNKLDKSQCVKWIILGGFGQVGGTVWNSVKPEWIDMVYEQPTYSTFSLTGSGNTISAGLFTLNPMEYDIILNFTDMTGAKQDFKAKMVAETPPNPNFKGACECGYGMGTFYYSYPLMNLQLQTGQDGENGKTLNGTAWMDHQLIKGGIPQGRYIQALETVTSMFGKSKGGWLWITIQDYETNTQYMLTHLFGKKFYSQDIVVGNEIPMNIVNVYEKGIVKFKGEKSVKVILEEKNVEGPEGILLPSKYSIVLPSGKKVILKIATAPNIYPVAHAPYETPSLLYDENGNTIGIGLIEANWYFDNKTIAKRLLLQSGGDVNSKEQFNLILNGIEEPQSFSQKLSAIFVVLIPVWIILLLVYFVRIKKEHRKYRLIIGIIILFFLLVMLK